jgi:hypothetical protein
MDRRIDHVATAWSDRTDAESACESVGLPTTYGGEHADGTTEMSIIGFPDGSYLELITNTGSETPARWPGFIAADAGPCAWCVEVDDLRDHMKRLIDADVHVSGPDRDGRERPDGLYVEWETAAVGGSLGRTLPFAIEDRTPRRYRVTPDPELEGGPLVGLSEVVVLTDAVASLVSEFDRALRVPSPVEAVADDLEARLSRFPGTPVAIADPFDGSARLRERLEAFGPAPCAALVETVDMAAASEELALTDPTRWADDRVAWFDHPLFHGRIGVIEYAH